MAFSAVQSHTFLGPLCVPGTPQSLERKKVSLGVKSCFPLIPEIQITQGVQVRCLQELGAAGNALGRQGQTPQPGCVPQGAGEQGRLGGTRTAPAPVSGSPGDWLWELEAGDTAGSLGTG